MHHCYPPLLTNSSALCVAARAPGRRPPLFSVDCRERRSDASSRSRTAGLFSLEIWPAIWRAVAAGLRPCLPRGNTSDSGRPCMACARKKGGWRQGGILVWSGVADLVVMRWQHGGKAMAAWLPRGGNYMAT